MKIRKISNYLLKVYPLDLQEEWDESGFLNRGNLNAEVTKCFVCLDLSNKVIDEAIKQKANLIISHHPVFHKHNDKDKLSYTKKLIAKVKKANITVLSLHTCFDLSEVGMNFLVANKLKLKNIGWYKKNSKNQFVVGNLKQALNIKQIVKLFKDTFGLKIFTSNVKSDSTKFNKLAIMSGSGLSVFATKYDYLAKEGYLLITGDIKHHGWQDLSEYNISALDVGHDIENCFVDYMINLLTHEGMKVEFLAITTAKKERVL